CRRNGGDHCQNDRCRCYPYAVITAAILATIMMVGFSGIMASSSKSCSAKLESPCEVCLRYHAVGRSFPLGLFSARRRSARGRKHEPKFKLTAGLTRSPFSAPGTRGDMAAIYSDQTVL